MWEERTGGTVDTSRAKKSWAIDIGVDEASVRRHLKHVPANRKPVEHFEYRNGDITANVVTDRILPLSHWLERMQADGFNPDDFTVSYSHSVWDQNSNENGLTQLYANRFSATSVRRPMSEPMWPVITPAAPVAVTISRVARTRTFTKWKTAVLMADTQIGYRQFEDGTLDPYHDDRAIDVALQIVALEQPDMSVVMGDILDLAEQGKFNQEARFANTTQAAFDRTHRFAAELATLTPGETIFIEGNHDKRMQNFVEANAKAAFGLRQANMPDSWPVMSIPNLLRLDELGIEYKDAYPTSHVWVNNVLRAEHGTKVNSSGSTAQKYLNETPHISRAFGHTHRLEAISRTTYDRMGKIRSMAINPGCLCRIDGAVPSVHGAIGANGRPAEVFEDWQQGVAVVRYTEDAFFVDLVQIDDGRTVYQGQELIAA